MHSAPTHPPRPLLLLTGRWRPGAGIFLSFSFPSVSRECPRRSGPHRGSGSQSKTEGAEGVVPAAPGSSSRSPGFALSVPGQCVPARPVLPARWPSSMDSCSKLNAVEEETTCQSSQMSQRLRERGTGRPVAVGPAPDQRPLHAPAPSAPCTQGVPCPIHPSPLALGLPPGPLRALLFLEALVTPTPASAPKAFLRQPGA